MIDKISSHYLFQALMTSSIEISILKNSFDMCHVFFFKKIRTDVELNLNEINQNDAMTLMMEEKFIRRQMKFLKNLLCDELPLK